MSVVRKELTKIVRTMYFCLEVMCMFDVCLRICLALCFLIFTYMLSGCVKSRRSLTSMAAARLAARFREPLSWMDWSAAAIAS